MTSQQRDTSIKSKQVVWVRMLLEYLDFNLVLNNKNWQHVAYKVAVFERKSL